MKSDPKFCLVTKHNQYRKCTEIDHSVFTWAYAMNGLLSGNSIRYYGMFDNYDITMVELTPENFQVVRELKRNSSTCVVGLVHGDLFPNWPSSGLFEYIEILNLVDMVGIINDKAYELISKLTTKPVHMIGIPYPVKWATENASVEKVNGLIELGSTPNMKGGIWSLAVFKQLNVNGVMYPILPDDHNGVVRFLDDNLSIEVCKPWTEYFKEHSKYQLGLHLDDRYTWGRFSLDCAGAKIPCVSSKGSHTQSILFPDLTVEYYEVDKAVELCKKLLSDPGFYNHVVDYALEQIKWFDLEPTKQRLLDLL